jgi:hypothetical protein
VRQAGARRWSLECWRGMVKEMVRGKEKETVMVKEMEMG